MTEIEMHEVSPEFAQCWQAAGLHLSQQVQGGINSWLKVDLAPPFLEHLSFRLGNQLFFVRIEDVDNKVQGPASRRGLLMVAEGCAGHACLLPMKKKMFGGWEPDKAGWGLVDAVTGIAVDPIALVTDKAIEMSDWELQDFAVQVVRDDLKSQGYKIMSVQGNPAVDPSIWFVGKSNGPEWAVVRASRYPDKVNERPANWDRIAQSCLRLSSIGHFATVGFASADEPTNADSSVPVPLWRGHGVHVDYEGLIF
jgi:hypothetical protein